MHSIGLFSLIFIGTRTFQSFLYAVEFSHAEYRTSKPGNVRIKQLTDLM